MPPSHRLARSPAFSTAAVLSAAVVQAKTPASIDIIGSTEVAQKSAEPFFARVTYTDTTQTVVTAGWTNGFSGLSEVARVFRFPAPAVSGNRSGTLSATCNLDRPWLQRG